MVLFFCMTWFLCLCEIKYCCNSLCHMGILLEILDSDNENLHCYPNCIWVTDQLVGLVHEKLVLVLCLSS